MNITELVENPEPLIDTVVEVEGVLNVVEDSSEVYLSYKEMDYSSSLLVSQDFWQFLEIIAAVQPGISRIGIRSFTISYPATVVGVLKRTGIPPFEYTLDNISSVSMKIEYDAVATMLVEPDFYHFVANIEYGQFREHQSNMRVTSIVTMPVQDTPPIPRLDNTHDYKDVIDKVVTVPGRLLGDLRTSAISIDGKQGANIAVNFPELILMLRRCIESSSGFPMFPYDFEITGRLVRHTDEEQHQLSLGMISEDEPILVLKDLQSIVMKRISYIQRHHQGQI